MRIYRDSLPPTSSSARAPWWPLRATLDPLIAVTIYFGALRVWKGPVTQDDLFIVCMSFALMFPGVTPFRRFTSAVVESIVLRWLLVGSGVVVFWAAKMALLQTGLQAQPNVVFSWMIAAPIAQLIVHSITPQIAPFLFPLYPKDRVVVVGANGVARRLVQLIRDGEAGGQQFIGFFDDREPGRLVPSAASAVIGRLHDVSAYVKANRINSIYISMPMASQPRIVSLLESLRDTTASIYFLPDIFIADLIQGRVTTMAGLPVVSVCETPFDGVTGALKRGFDVLLVLSSLPVLLPLMITIGLLVRATSPGPAIFRQRRYGLDGREIVVWKFRTMSTLEDGHSSYTQVTREDPRVTPLGKFLRRTSLDELPQLLNVLRGSMSLVGPRPHALAVNEQYRKLIPGYMVRHKVKPGITGWAQVNGCRGGDDLDSMRRRTDYDLAYLRSWSPWLDLLIIAKTVKMMMFGDKGAY